MISGTQRSALTRAMLNLLSNVSILAMFAIEPSHLNGRTKAKLPHLFYDSDSNVPSEPWQRLTHAQIVEHLLDAQKVPGTLVDANQIVCAGCGSCA